jgi:PBSX family phage terminase large subunit
MLHDLSLKQKESLAKSNARLNVWEGSVRSGKSFSALLRFIEFACSDIKGDMCVVGKSTDSIKRNIISELARLLGSEMQYFAGNRELHLWNRVIHVIGANDDRAEGKIRGSTMAGALVDEASTIPENFFKMLLSRLSIDGAKMFLTTNPDSPFHWLKTEFIDRAKELDLLRFKFVLDDNPSLTKDYKDNLKKEYRGLWYRRFIDGDWVLAEGAIYDFFDEDIHCISNPPHRGKYYIVSVDYGTTNPCAFGMYGCNTDKYPNIFKEKEYYWSSKEHLRQKTDEEYVRDLINFCNGYNVRAVLVDPSAASFIAECRKQGIRGIQDANNNVLDGIRFFSQLLTTGTLKICKQCKRTLQEIQTYVWDEKAAMRGEEKPKKANDHCMDETRYASMYWFEQGKNSTTPEELQNRYNKAMGNQTNLPAFFRDTF